MPIDRAATLRSAEKCLRQGKLDSAIAEYLRITADQPRDWSTANIVGDLYARAGKVEQAIEQYVRIADALSEEGFLPKASALYKKVLRLRPEHEHSLLRCAEIATAQGVLVDARTFLGVVADRRRARGDRRGAAEVSMRLCTLDPNDYAARIRGARARLDLDDVAGALCDLQDIVAELLEKDRPDEAVQAAREAVSVAPDDQAIRGRLIVALVRAGLMEEAQVGARTLHEFETIASELARVGRTDEAAVVLERALALEPSDERLRSRLDQYRPQVAEAPAESLAKGPMSSECDAVADQSAVGLDVGPTLDDALPAATDVSPVSRQLDAADSSWSRARDCLLAGRFDEGRLLLHEVVHREPGRRQEIALLGLTLCQTDCDSAFQLMDLAADAAIAAGDWESAAAGLQEFVTRVPAHLPALMRLVEISVDGGLTATMHSAQAQLADAYLDAGAAREAHFIAEDLVAREPWERAHLDRCRRALIMLGEGDPDAVIARRLSGETPFTSTDAAVSATAGPVHAAVVAPDRDLHTPAPHPVHDAVPITGSAVASAGGPELASGPPVIELESTTAASVGQTGHDESRQTPGEAAASLVDPVSALEPPSVASTLATAGLDLARILGQLRDDPSRRESMTDAEHDFEKGLELYAAGEIDDSIGLLTKASNSPRLRFVTAALLARIHRDQGLSAHAVVWFDQASQAPPPSPEEGRALLYDFGDLLEAMGARARALSTFSDLFAEAPDYRDVSLRVARLTPTAARG